MTDEAHKLIKTIRQMRASLEDPRRSGSYEEDRDGLRVTAPLTRCLVDLKEQYKAVHRYHRERVEEVVKLVQALESYASHLEASFLTVKLPPANADAIPPTFNLSPSYVASIDAEFGRVYEEYGKRVNTVTQVCEETIQLWAELGTPQAQTDPAIVKHYKDSPEQLGLHEADLARLRSKRDRLIEEKKNRERRIKELRQTIEALWDRLGVEESDRKGFVNSNRGCSLRSINEFEDELARLNELKRQNLHLFVEDARCRLQELWDSLYFSEEEMLDFTPAFSDVYSDALLESHEGEIARLEALREQREPILAMIERHKSLIGDRDSLQASSQDASRLMLRGQKGEKRDPTRLLREEKMRKRIAKELPKVEEQLRRELELYEEEYGRPFMVHGERYLDEMAAEAAKAAPPRSKTPSSMGPPPPRAKTPSVSRTNSAKSQTPSTSGAPSRSNSSAKVNPPSRTNSKTPTGGSTLKRSQFGQSVSSNNGTLKSPTKLPTRPPLGTTNGNSSPNTMRPVHKHSASVPNNNASKTMGPPRAPPPRMRDLFEPPNETPAASYSSTMSRFENLTLSSDRGSVRPITPEDVYLDRPQSQLSYMEASLMQRQQEEMQRPAASYVQRPYTAGAMAPPPRPFSRTELPPRPASRQFSGSSVANTITSGSENWETYESEAEVDPAEAYYARMRAAHSQGKKMSPPPNPNQFGSLASRKLRSFGENGEIRTSAEMRVVDGSDAGWTDIPDEETY